MTYTLLEAKWKKPICWRARSVRGECASEADPWRIDDLGAEMLIQKLRKMHKWGGRQKDGSHDAKLPQLLRYKGTLDRGLSFLLHCIAIADRLQCMKKENIFVNHDTP
jgi:hypothetical protein